MIFVVGRKEPPQKTSPFKYPEPYLNKGLLADVTKLRVVVQRLPQILQVGPKCHRKGLNKKEAEGNDTTEEKEALVPTEERLDRGCGRDPGNAGSQQEPEEARHGFSPRASGGSSVMLMP